MMSVNIKVAVHNTYDLTPKKEMVILRVRRLVMPWAVVWCDSLSHRINYAVAKSKVQNFVTHTNHPSLGTPAIVMVECLP